MITAHSAPPTTLLRDIGQLYVVPPGPLTGARMRQIDVVRDAVVLIEDGRIRWFGPAAEAPGLEPEIILSAVGGCVIPGLIDCHTHVPFVGGRSGEFTRRVAGETYLSIMQSGGGIRVTTAAVRAASRAELVDENLARLRRMLAHGVTTCECKSGYGLSRVEEVKQLEAVRALARSQPLRLAPTYMGAHAVPAEFEGRATDFLDEIAAEPFLRELGHRKLARFCDVFCDRGAFTVEQARRVLTAAAAAGLRLKIHADELAQIGASRLAGELRAVSADHLEVIDDDGIAALKAGGTIAVVLPGCSFYLGIAHAPARRMIEAGLPVAIATDCNPGSSMIESLPLAMNIACCQMRLLPVEVLAACTANAAAALELQDQIGAIAPEYAADLTVLDAESIDEWMYTVGRPRVSMVMRAGRIVYES